MDWLAEICAEVEKNTAADEAKIAEIDAGVVALKAKIAELESKRADWAGRTYKSNTNVHMTEDEMPTSTYGQINERRRRSRIRGFTAQIAKIESEIAELENSKAFVGLD